MASSHRGNSATARSGWRDPPAIFTFNLLLMARHQLT